MADLSNWRGCPKPDRIELRGTYCKLSPLAMDCADALYAASMAPGAEDRYRYLSVEPQTRSHFDDWLAIAAQSTDPLYYAVFDVVTGRCEGRQSLMRIDSNNGVIEVGNILWGPAIAKTRIATEALYLMAEYVFDQLGYRRFEWKCDALNEPSRRAALRFGFHYEGLFRQHMIVKGRNRDTAWFAMLDSQWPYLRTALQAWLAPANFDASGQQLQRLQAFL